MDRAADEFYFANNLHGGATEGLTSNQEGFRPWFLAGMNSFYLNSGFVAFKLSVNIQELLGQQQKLGRDEVNSTRIEHVRRTLMLLTMACPNGQYH
jgi:hypothetical protein